MALFARRVAVYPGDGLGDTRAATTIRLNLSRRTHGRWSISAAVLGDALAEAASGRWRDAGGVAARAQGHRARGAARAGRSAGAREPLAAVGRGRRALQLEPARVRRRLARAVAADARRLLVQDQPPRRFPARGRLAGAGAEVVCEAEYELAIAVVETDPAQDRGRRSGQARCAAGARRRRRGAGARRLGRRARSAPRPRRRAGSACGSRSRALPARSTRFGIAPARDRRRGARRAALGLTVEALSTHLVSTDFDPAAGRRRGQLAARRPTSTPAQRRAGAPRARAARRRPCGRDDRPRRRVSRRAGGRLARPRGRGRAARRRLRRARCCSSPAARWSPTPSTSCSRVVAVKTLADGSRCLVVRRRHELPPRRADRAAADRGARRRRPVEPRAGHAGRCA